MNQQVLARRMLQAIALHRALVGGSGLVGRAQVLYFKLIHGEVPPQRGPQLSPRSCRPVVMRATRS